MAFEPGHQLSKGPKQKHIYDAMMREVIQNPAKLKKACAMVLDQAANGDLDSLDWIACRLEGKANQQVNVDSTLAISIETDRPKLTADQWLAQHGVIDVIPSVINTLAQESILSLATPGQAQEAPLSLDGASDEYQRLLKSKKEDTIPVEERLG